MPYIHRTIEAGNTIEHKKYYNGRYRAKIKNSPAINETPQNQKDYQDRNAEEKVRRLINQNFWFGDYWLTLTYPAWKRPSSKKAKKDIDSFLDKMRKYYKKAGKLLKYIMTAGRGKQGAVHFHLVVNAGIDASEISEIWWGIAGTKEVPCPRVNIRVLDKSGYYGKIAAYLIKNSKETFWSDDRIHAKRYCSSRSLKQPVINRDIVDANTWRKEPKPPKGYYLLKDSLYSSVDECGYLFQKYIFVRIKSVDIRSEADKKKRSSKIKPRSNLNKIKVEKHSRLKTSNEKIHKKKRIKSKW